MKKIILLFLISFSGFAQEIQFVYTKESGLTDFIVTKCEGKSRQELYKKVIDWISVFYNNPKEVIKAEIIDDYIRIEGLQKNVPLGTFMGIKNKYKHLDEERLNKLLFHKDTKKRIREYLNIKEAVFNNTTKSLRDKNFFKYDKMLIPLPEIKDNKLVINFILSKNGE